MGTVNKWIAEASQRLELPVDVVAGLPRMELTGRHECSMEPHGGLLAYSREQILVKSRLGPVEVMGKDLTVKLMNQQRIVIAGTIFGVRLPEDSGE